jgi:hypothetical protein
MADSYFLRPSADKGTLGHTCSTGSSGYSLINEETHDSDNGYIYHKCSYTSSSKSSTFLFTESKNPTVSTTLPNGIMYGDIDQDGYITADDKTKLSNHLAQITGEILNGDELALADVNGDGSVDVKDLRDVAFMISDSRYLPSVYKGDYLNNWSFDSTSARFYYDISTTYSNTSCVVNIICDYATDYYGLVAKCFSGYVRVYAYRLPYYAIPIELEIINKSSLVQINVPAGLMYGDVDMDGVLSQKDVDSISDHAIDLSTIEDETALILADVNGDGNINTTDALLVSQLVSQSSSLSTYKGDYLGNWSVNNDTWGFDSSRRFYYDITRQGLTASNFVVKFISDTTSISHNCFNWYCFDNTIRIYAKDLPLESLTLYIQIVERSNSRSLTLPAGLMYGDVDLDGKLTSRDVALIKTHVLTDNATITDPTALSLLDINGDGSTSYAKDHKLLDRLLNPSGNNTGLDTYAGDSLGNWTFDVNKRKFYCDLSTNMITSSTSSEYYIYLINDKDSYEICYTYETYDGYIRIYARNLPKNDTNINIVIVKKESYPLDTVSGVNLHLVARGSSSVTSPSIKCLFAVGSENGGTSAEMGIESSTLTTSYADYSASSAAMATAINNYIAANNAFPTISATLTTSGTSYA